MAELEVKYFDPRRPGSYAGLDKFYRSGPGASRKRLKQWLKGEESYTLHKPVRYTFKRNRVVVSGIDSQWDVDLIDMIQYKKSNDDYKHILVTTDILSHYAWTRALKSKTGREVSKSLSNIFAGGRVPTTIRSDKGSEFKNSTVQSLFKSLHIHHFVTHNEVKANYVERLNRTLKLKMSRYFTHKQTHKWIDVLSAITYSYNHTYHSTIKRTPASVTIDNAVETWKIQYDDGDTPSQKDKDFTLTINSFVRISHLRKAFQREYDERYTGEIFRVKSRRKRAGLNVYTLEDLQNEQVEGTFYEFELQQVTVTDDGLFKVERILKSRKRRGHEKEYLIKWKDYPKKFNSWISASDVQDV